MGQDRCATPEGTARYVARRQCCSNCFRSYNPTFSSVITLTESAARAHQMIAGLYGNKELAEKEIEHYLKGLSFLEGKTLPFKERYTAQQVADNILLNLADTYRSLGNYRRL